MATRHMPGLVGPFRGHRPILTPRSRWTARCGSRAHESTEAGDRKSGHIDAASNESILWFDRLYPLKLSGLLRLPWLNPESNISELTKRFEKSSMGIMNPMNLVKRALKPDLPIEVTEIVPRIKDGGAFVKFTHPAGISPREIEEAVTKELTSHPVKPIFSPFRAVQAGLVKGMPWLEDLHRFPKTRLRVEFVPPNPGEEAVELSQESLYSLFRRYGKIAEITSQPWDSKVVPKFAYVDFSFIRDAIMARNCLHGFVVSEELGGGKLGTKFRISYEKRANPHKVWDWLTNHPRIVIPALVALLTGVTVVVFDPIRSFFVEAHVSKKFRLANNRLYRWLRKQTSHVFAFKREKAEQAGLNAVWTHRKDLIEQIQTWLIETAETFIVVQGPRGSGKRELVMEQALKDRRNVLVIDCKNIIEARGETGIIKKMASEVGYRPIFSWANSMSSMIDLAIQGTTGVKAGFSETLDSQLEKILQTTAGALQTLDLEDRSKHDADASMPADAYLDAHPERRAVVVIDNFEPRSDNNAIVYEKLAEWASMLVETNTAHVIFLTRDGSYTKTLTKSLPDRVFRHAALGDLSPDVAKRYVLSHVTADDPEPDQSEDDEEKAAKPRPKLAGLDDCIETLGGRLTDLEFLARRIKAGLSPKKAVSEITEESASEILKMFLLLGKTTSDGEHSWSMEQAWYLIKALSQREALGYNEVLQSNTFDSSLRCPDGKAALEGLANSDLITLRTRHGRPQSIGVGKPVYQAAFRFLASDAVLAAEMDLAVLTELAKIEAKNIEKAEAELSVLAVWPRQPAEITDRVGYLLAKLESAQKKVRDIEKDMSPLKKVLAASDP
ncbi:RNA12 protein-domain-containing protein [Xylariaceae sp. FL1019]|nr:RNA12 protein-domain-containing protein [Xylariaceae sp. FL1019]